MNVSLELFENLAQQDAYLLYLPSIPRTVGSETLYIIAHQEQLIFIVDAVKKMADTEAQFELTQKLITIVVPKLHSSFGCMPRRY